MNNKQVKSNSFCEPFIFNLPKEVLVNLIFYLFNDWEFLCLYYTCTFFQRLVDEKGKKELKEGWKKKIRRRGPSSSTKHLVINYKLFKWGIDYMGLYWNTKVVLKIFARQGDMSGLEFIVNNKELDMSVNWNSILLGAFKGGHLNVLKWVDSKIKLTIESFDMYMIYAITKRGHIHILEWINNCLTKNQTTTSQLSSFWKKFNCTYAAKGNQYDTIKWLIKNGCLVPHLDSYLAAIEMGNLEMLKWLHQNFGLIGLKSDTLCYFASELSGKAVKLGRLEILKWLKSQNENLFKKDLPLICCEAIMSGHLEILQWILDNTNDNYSSPWSQKYSVCGFAAGIGRLDLIQCIKANGGPWDEMTCSGAVYANRFDILKWVIENGCPWGLYTCSNAALRGRIDIVEWCIEHGCSWGDDVFCGAVLNQNINNLKWLKEKGCPWGISVTTAAAETGNLEVIQWLIQNGCPWEEKTIFSAACNGQLEFIKWATDNGCPWDKDASLIAAENGHFEIIKWIVENGYHLHKVTCLRAAESGHYEIVNFLFKGRYVSLKKNTTGRFQLLNNLVADGEIKILDLAMKNGYIDHTDSTMICELSSQYGWINIIKWLIKNGWKLEKKRSIKLANDNGYYNLAEWLEKQPISNNPFFNWASQFICSCKNEEYY